MTLDSYIESIRDKTIAVVGVGVSNRPLVDKLLDSGCRVTVCDKRDREKMGSLADELESKGCILRLGENYLQGLQEDIIFRTPGLHPFTKELAEAKKRGAVLTSEMEAFFKVCPCHIIAITGSDGKTTTTTIVSELLKASGYRVHLGGNIGKPLLTETPNMQPEDWAVLELSSFQLHSMDCHPDIAIITNISPNHLDIHPSYKDYQDAKKQIFRSFTGENTLVLNLDNDITKSFANETDAEVRFFSRREKPEHGVYLENGNLYRAVHGAAACIMSTEDIRIPGLHNAENFMAAFAATQGIVSDEICRQVAMSFSGVAHRLEMIRTLHGVTYCNDSIASSPTRTIAGLHALRQKTILIAGGYDKHIPFDELGDEICQHVKALFLTGFTSEKIRDAVVNSPFYEEGKLPIIMEDDFQTAVLVASASAEKGDLVLLSPACASFDHFKNFEERGNTFRRIVMEME